MWVLKPCTDTTIVDGICIRGGTLLISNQLLDGDGQLLGGCSRPKVHRGIHLSPFSNKSNCKAFVIIKVTIPAGVRSQSRLR